MVYNAIRAAVEGYPSPKLTLTDRKHKYTRYTTSSPSTAPGSSPSRFKTCSYLSLRTLQIFQQFGSLVDEPAQAPPVRNVPFKFPEVIPYLKLLKGQQRG